MGMGDGITSENLLVDRRPGVLLSSNKTSGRVFDTR